MIPTLYMLCGLPGSGKSTYAMNKLSSQATVYSSDALREELLGDVNSQVDNKTVFDTLHKNIADCLKSGLNAVYDATNLYSKYRKEYLDSLVKAGIRVHKVCIFMETPYYECLYRNSERDRVVPEEVIERMHRNFDYPVPQEGWDEIIFVRPDKFRV